MASILLHSLTLYIFSNICVWLSTIIFQYFTYTVINLQKTNAKINKTDAIVMSSKQTIFNK